MRRTATWLAACMAALLALVAMGCENDSEPVAVERVTLNTTALTLAPGETKKLAATVLPSNADDKSVKWSSSDTAVATVGADGTVMAIKAGTATITAQAGGKTATCEVTVKPILVAVESVTLNKEMLMLTCGETERLTATVLPGNANDKTVAWSSSSAEIATVSDDGTVTAVTKGTAIIIARAGGKVAACTVTVNPMLVEVENVALDKEILTLTCGETGKLTATVLPGNADDKTVAWSSSDETVATVGNDGTVTAGKVGTTYITASAGGMAARRQVTVNVPDVEGFEIDSNGWLTKYSGTDAVVVIPNGVTKIGSDAFEGCTSLTSVTIPDGVTSIGSYAFYGCTGLTSVTIPNSVTGIWSHAFEGCNNVYTVTYGGTKELWKAIERQVSLNPTCIICSDGHIGVKDVPPYLTMRGMTVTGHTDDLPTELDIPDGVTSIGDSAFKGCTGLTSVTIPDGVTYIVGSAFKGCTGLTSVVIPDGVTRIEDMAFNGCTGLTSVVIPGGVMRIDNKAFNGCTGLTDVVLSDGVNVEYREIGDSTFNGCTSLTSVTIGDGLTSIGRYAFEGCTNLKSVEIPYGVRGIGDYAFKGCTGLTSVVIDDGLTHIGMKAFNGCTGLTSVVIGSSVTSIGPHAFNGCTSLTNIVIPDGVKNFSDCAFNGCTGLTNIVIPDSVTSIGNSAFKGCTGLTSVTIGGGVTNIGDKAFNGCTNLKSVIYKGTEYEWGNVSGYGKSELSDKVTFAK